MRDWGPSDPCCPGCPRTPEAEKDLQLPSTTAGGAVRGRDLGLWWENGGVALGLKWVLTRKQHKYPYLGRGFHTCGLSQSWQCDCCVGVLCSV